MKERPILFNAPNVRALLDGSKTQTRRVAKLKPDDLTTLIEKVPNKAACYPYGQVGDRLWVRETFMDMRGTGIEHDGEGDYYYRADVTNYGEESRKDFGLKWKPSIFMPRRASRITLEITNVRVEKLQDISEADATAEGTPHSLHLAAGRTAKENYIHLWETINGDDSWDLNPLVWVIEFKKVGH